MDFEDFLYNENCEIDSTTNPYDAARQAFKSGQQSKQAEIDALKEKISKVLYAIAQSELHGDRAIWGIQDEIKEILK